MCIMYVLTYSKKVASFELSSAELAGAVSEIQDALLYYTIRYFTNTILML